MSVEFLADGAQAVVRRDGAKHRFDVDGDTADLEDYHYAGPEDNPPDAVLDELEQHAEEFLQEDDDEDGAEDVDRERDENGRFA